VIQITFIRDLPIESVNLLDTRSTEP
jgi:hypothetical protein